MKFKGCSIATIVAFCLFGYADAQPPRKCPENIKYWAKKKMNFFEFDHLHHFAQCLHDSTKSNDPVTKAYKVIEPEVYKLSTEILKQRNFCSGSHMQKVVDFGEKYIKPLEGEFNWEKSHKDLVTLIQSRVTSNYKSSDSESDDIGRDEIDKLAPEALNKYPKLDESVDELEPEDSSSDSNEPLIVEQDSEGQRRKLLWPFRRIYYGYVAQVGDLCWTLFKLRTKETLETDQFNSYQQELCKLADVQYKKKKWFSSSGKCTNKLKAENLESILPGIIGGEPDEANNSLDYMQDYIRMIDGYLKQNLPKDAMTLIKKANENSDDSCKAPFSESEREVLIRGHQKAMSKLHEACVKLKSAYDVVISPVTVLAAAGYHIDSVKLFAAKVRTPCINKWLQIQRVCEIVLRTSVKSLDDLQQEKDIHGRKLTSYELASHYQLELRLNTDIILDNPGHFRESIHYLKCRGRNNQFCGYVFVHPVRTALIALMIGIGASALATGITFGIMVLVSGFATTVASAVPVAAMASAKCAAYAANYMYMAATAKITSFGLPTGLF